MKRTGSLHEKICDFENIFNAYLKARRLKRYRSEVLEFSKNLEENLIIIYNELYYMTYKTSKYFEFTVYDPKKRKILALPFKDRVVHHAINNIIEPIFDATFIYDSYACRKGKGTIAGMKRLRKFMDSILSKYDRVYYLKADVEKYFYSIDHDILKKLIRRKIKCAKTLALLDEIIESTGDKVGIPIGNLTSQLFANIYLNYLDHKIKDDWGVKYYVRYMDDFIILHHDKTYLKDLLEDIKIVLSGLRLNLNHKTRIDVVNKGIDFLGFRLFPNYTILRKRIYRKNMRKFKKFSELYEKGEMGLEEINQSIQSFLGLCKHCQSYHARKNVFNKIII